MLHERLRWGEAGVASITLNPIATILGAAAATIILLEVLRLSSSWTSYVTTSQEIQASLEDFRINWRRQIVRPSARRTS